MTYSRQDETCANVVRHDLESSGYQILTATRFDPADPFLMAREVERGVRISLAVIALWSAEAKQSEWVERYYTLAERLKKPLIFVRVDETASPVVSSDAKFVKSGPSGVEATAQVLPHLPAPKSDEKLSEALLQLASERTPERRVAIEQAAQLLNEQSCRNQLLPLLEDIARNDEISNLRDLARSQIESFKSSQPDASGENELPYIFKILCPHGTTHVNRFDKRDLCGKYRRAYRRIAGAELDTISVTCQTCGCAMEFELDCEGYK
jgi:hypothetical protein